MAPRSTTFAARAAGLGVACIKGAPARRSPVMAELHAGLRATFSLQAPAFYSP